MKNKKRTIIILSITILLLILISVLYVTYAYMGTRIIGDETSKKVTLTGQIIKVKYSDGAETLSTPQTGYFVPGATISKTFTLTNTGNVNLDFSININDLVNDFVRKEDIIYELYLGEYLVIKDILPSTSSNVVLAYNQKLNKEESKTYTLKITYLQSEENQIIDQGKMISGNISFEKQNKGLSGIKILGNTIQNGTPSPTTPVEMESVGNKILKDDNINEEVNLFDNTKLLKSTNANEKWEITETGIRQTLIGQSGYIEVTLFDITDLVEPNTSYYFHADMEFNYDTTSNVANSLSGAMVIYIDGVSQYTIYRQGGDIWVNIPDDFEKIEIRTLTVVSPSLIVDYDENESYYFEWKNIYMSKIPYYYKESYDYLIPVKITGKNLFDEELLLENGVVTKSDNGYSTSAYPSVYNSSSKLVKHLKSVLKPNQTYTLSRRITSYNGDSSGAIYIRNTSGTMFNVTYGNGIKSKTFSLTQEQINSIDSIYVYGSKNTPTNYEYIQLEIGDKATEYEPYNGKNYDLYLDEPLRKVGSCADYSCMDYIDLNTRKLFRNIRYMEFTGNESWKAYNYNNVYKGFSLPGFIEKKITRLPGISNMSSNVGQYYSGNFIWLGINSYELVWGGSGHYDSTLSDSGLANFKAFLNENHLKIQYVTPTKTSNDVGIPPVAAIPPNSNIIVDTTVPAEIIIE